MYDKCNSSKQHPATSHSKAFRAYYEELSWGKTGKIKNVKHFLLSGESTTLRDNPTEAPDEASVYSAWREGVLAGVNKILSDGE